MNELRSKKLSHMDDKLLKLLIELFSRHLYKTKIETTKIDKKKMYNNKNRTSPAATNKNNNNNLPQKYGGGGVGENNLENDLIRVEYYNDFNSCLSLSQTLSVLNSGNYETARKLASSINSAATQIITTTTTTTTTTITTTTAAGVPAIKLAVIPSKSTTKTTTTAAVATTVKSTTAAVTKTTGAIETVKTVTATTHEKNTKMKTPEKRKLELLTDVPDSKYTMTVTCRSDGDSIFRLGAEHQKVIKLDRETSQSFGISIVGGKVNVSEDVWISGVFVKDIIPNSAADMCKQLRIGDRILAIDDIDLSTSTHQQAVNVIRKAGQTISVLVESFKETDNQLEELNKEGKNSEVSPQMPFKFDKKVPPPVTPSKSPLPEIIQDAKKPPPVPTSPPKTQPINIETKKVEEPESDYSSDEEDDNSTEMTGRTVTHAGIEIDRGSAGNVKRTKEESSIDKEKEDKFGYTSEKIKKRYGTLGHVYKCMIDRSSNTPIGLSLAGHKDRNKMACFVAGVNPKGIAAITPVKVGDEILEVNGVVLHGRCHLNASVIIKELPGVELNFVLLRRQAGSDDLAVKPLKQFPLSLFDDSDDMFSTFKNVKTIKIRKGTQGLGIMIIEGKHSDAGQGIFISDIQEGSNAEQAGLGIGDMILSVNSDILIGTSYETAASLLKKSEGIVSLKVCSPSKEKDAKSETDINLSGLTADNVSAKTPKTPIKDRSLSASPLPPKVQKSPAKEAPINLATAPIASNKESEIEIRTEGKPLGVRVVGGSNTYTNTGTVIVQIYPKSPAEKDNRLQLFDQILEVNGTKLVSTFTSDQIERTVKQLAPKLKMTIYRADPNETTTLTVDFIKKSGKMIGIELLEVLPHGVIVTDLIAGSSAALDNRLQVGDIITHINNDDIRKLKVEDCMTLLRTSQGSITLKAIRPAPKKR